MTPTPHSSEPWKASGEALYSEPASAAIAMLLGTPGVQEANALRIALCINACQGMTNQELEAWLARNTEPFKFVHERLSEINRLREAAAVVLREAAVHEAE